MFNFQQEPKGNTNKVGFSHSYNSYQPTLRYEYQIVSSYHRPEEIPRGGLRERYVKETLYKTDAKIEKDINFNCFESWS
jgi:hypothetical protein